MLKSNSVSLEGIVDLEHYPIHQYNSQQYKDLVDNLSRMLDTEQICVLPNFITETTRLNEVESVMALQEQAHAAHSLRNVYLEQAKSPEFPERHSKNIMAEARYRMIGAHILDQRSALKTLYYTEEFQQFIAAVTRSNRLYPSADPYQPVNVICYGDGDRSAWHFDSTSAFTMTLMLQAPDQGGEFEIVPNIRSTTNSNEQELCTLLLGDRSKVQNFQRQEGALVIFRGSDSAHRVTEVTGERKRLMCVMVYENKPGVIGDPVVNETVYGIPA